MSNLPRYKHEIIIVDLSSDIKLSNKYKDLNLSFDNINYKGTFWKTKALNRGVSLSSYDNIMILDSDSLINDKFFDFVFNYLNTVNRSYKLCHRVVYLDKINDIICDHVDKNNKEEFNKVLKSSYGSLRVARERFTENENVYSFKKDNDITCNKSLGNSHFTMLKSDFIKIGGYDERFIGHGYEDLDFNLRAFRFLKKGYLCTDFCNLVFHQNHDYESSWLMEKTQRENKEIYRYNSINNISVIEKNKDWGKF